MKQWWILFDTLQASAFWVNGTPSWNDSTFFLEFWFLIFIFRITWMTYVSSKNPPKTQPQQKTSELFPLTVAPVAGSYDGVALDEWPGRIILDLSLKTMWFWKVLWEGTLESSVQIHWGAFDWPASMFTWLGHRSCFEKAQACCKWILARVRYTSDVILWMTELEWKVYQRSRYG